MLLKPNVNMNSSNTLFLQAGNDLWYHIANAYRWQRIPFPNFKIQQAPATPQRGIAFTLFSCFVHNTGPVAQTLARASSFSKQDNTSTLCEHDGAQCNTHTHCVRLSLTHTLSLSLSHTHTHTYYLSLSLSLSHTQPSGTGFTCPPDVTRHVAPRSCVARC